MSHAPPLRSAPVGENCAYFRTVAALSQCLTNQFTHLGMALEKCRHAYPIKNHLPFPSKKEERQMEKQQ